MLSGEPKVAVITTRRLNPKTGKYYSQEDARALELEGKFGYQRRPFLYHECQEGNQLRLNPFLKDDDAINSSNVIMQKITTLFSLKDACIKNGLFEEAILYIHGFNCGSQNAKNDAYMIYKITEKPVIVFDWASTHDFFFGPPLL